MDSHKALDQYLENSVRTASPEQLTLMLFNGCIKNLNLARKGIAERDIAGASRYLIKAQRIVGELRDTLDPNYELSHKLAPVYQFVIETLVAANIRKDPEKIAIVCGLITELRDAWHQAMSRMRSGAPNAAAAQG